MALGQRERLLEDYGDYIAAAMDSRLGRALVHWALGYTRLGMLRRRQP
jgi:hypothetical protein